MPRPRRVPGRPARRVLLLVTALASVLAAFLTPALAPGRWGPDHAQAAAPAILCTQFGGGPPYNFATYEASRDRAAYLVAQRLAAQNALLPGDATFALPPIEVGAFGQRVADAGTHIPATLLHAIGWIESRLNMAAASVPYESTGDVLLSSSCAYGVMQVASFFSNGGDVPSRAEALAGTHYAFNVAAGAAILVDKYNGPFFPQVGLADPRFLESWYYAVWGYNGWAFSNHPAGAEVDPFRPLPFDCDGPYNGYAYQELVLGYYLCEI